MLFRICIVAAAALLTLTPKLDAQNREAARQTIERSQADGRKAMNEARYPESVRILEEGKKEAASAGERQAQANLAIQQGRALEAWAATEPAQRARMAEATAAYQEAIQAGTRVQQAVAGNQLGTLLLKQGQNRQAVEAFRQIPLDGLEPAQRSVIEFNYARALESNNSPQDAYDHYVRLASEQGFKPAADAAFRLLESGPQPRIADALSLAESELRRGHAQSGLANVRQLVSRWVTSPDAGRLLAILVRYYAVIPITVEQFREQEQPWLNRIKETASLRRAVEEIETAYLGGFGVVLSPSRARELFPYWARAEAYSQPFAALLTSIGHDLEEREQFDTALARFTAAWSIYPADVDAAVEAAALLRDQRQQLDRNRALLDRLIAGVFAEKGSAYGADDWPTILRLHIVLGKIFEMEMKWGSASESASAIFQWTHALQAEEQIRRRDPRFSPSPGLHLSLANAYQQTNNSVQAWEQYIQAAQGFAQTRNRPEATAALDSAKKLAVPLDAAKQTRVAALERSLQN